MEAGGGGEEDGGAEAGSSRLVGSQLLDVGCSLKFKVPTEIKKYLN